jgi:alpha-L-fucosidase
MLQPWFQNAKLGIFVHWGLYAVQGVPESWAMFNGQISQRDYLAQAAEFTASAYDPHYWAALFARAGARYAVLTAKHHDGFALWDTALSQLNAVQAAPAGRDLVGPYCAALRSEGLKVGLYFSHLDWAHPDYAPLPPAERTKHTLTNDLYTEAWPEGGGNVAWQRFLAFQRGQIRELCERYQPDLLWFDGDWTPGPSYWRMGELRSLLDQWLPHGVLNGRMREHGDYATPEQGAPIVPPVGPWELCITMNDSWGYQVGDERHKSVRQLIRIFAETISMGGNLLLGIGPHADGTLQSAQVERLEELGAWIARHSEAIYPTDGGLPAGHHYGASTLSSDKRTLYLFVFDRPWEHVALKGLRNQIERVSVLGTGQQLPYRLVGGAPWHGIPGTWWIDIPEAVIDPLATVLKVELDGPLALYRGSGQAIESN